MIMARTQKAPPTEPLKVVSVKLTPATEHALQRLSQNASDALGWTVSNSAMIRALVSYAGQQPYSWASSTLHSLIEQEIAGGRVWGKKRQE